MALELVVGQNYRIRHETFGLFFARCTVVNGDFVGFELVEGNGALVLHGYEPGDGIYGTTKYFAIEKG